MDYFPIDKVSPEREEEIIEKVAERIVRKYDATLATLFLESFRPLVYVYGEMGHLFTPLLGAFGTGTEILADEYLIIFKKRENIDRLVRRIEERRLQEEVSRGKGKDDGKKKSSSFIDRVKSLFFKGF